VAKARWLGAISGALVVGALATTAVIWGRQGLEVLSWLSGVGSLLVGVITLRFAVSPRRERRAGTEQQFSARLDGDGRINQAGGNISNWT